MRTQPRTLIGTVVSAAMQKTAVVRVEHVALHPKYRKYVRRSKSYNVHDERGEAKVGSRVEIAECRPLSRTKSWRLVRVIAKPGGES